ncbi:hypothetical protein [Fischerella sp. NIES-3754]|uniref:hypothetical protein n=1 Tax=Fischerella sp. NIES-3754 TaxID=1752063 RepID=UPI000722080F|nr:hypothetical protein [Fischerella sp. NIES-3754]BAU08887.1 hypothetical protein FIS3754_48460 [Fischerella sp. NIES-3754]BCX06363.1 MAG: hypothetical protein KatS3mg066_0222 [Fischerella sp.]
MKILRVFAACVILITVGNTAVAYNIIPTSQNSILQLNNNRDVNSVTAINTRNSHSSSDYQESTISLSAFNLSRPHILSINTSGSELQGNITFDGRVIRQIRGKRVFVNLSPYLSKGKHIVKISTRYFPASSSVKVEFSGLGINVTQETSGSGRLNYILNVSVY